MKNRMLKIAIPILIVVCLICVAALTACGSVSGATDADVTNATTATTTTTTTATTTTEEATSTEGTEATTGKDAEETVSDETSGEAATEEPEATGGEETTETGSEDAVIGYEITFIVGEHATVTVYDTQDVDGEGSTSGTAYARSGSTGEILINGDGQVNFVVSVDVGYEIGSIRVAGTYKNLKTPEDTGTAAYRITKIESDLTVTIDVNEAGTKYTGTFVLGEGVRAVLVSETQDMTAAAEATKAYARNSETGEILSDGNGQINFLVVLEDGYTIDGITVEGGYNKLKNDPEGDGSANCYRITKITSDLTITITATQE